MMDDRYMRCAPTDGAPFDPALRTHRRPGARIAPAALEPMIRPGKAGERATGAGLRLPEGGRFAVHGSSAHDRGAGAATPRRTPGWSGSQRAAGGR